jgi:hypothetical protein
VATQRHAPSFREVRLPGVPLDVLQLDAEVLPVGAVHELVATLGVGHPQDDGRPVRHRPEALLALAKGVLRGRVLRDVRGRAHPRVGLEHEHGGPVVAAVPGVVDRAHDAAHEPLGLARAGDERRDHVAAEQLGRALPDRARVEISERGAGRGVRLEQAPIHDLAGRIAHHAIDHHLLREVLEERVVSTPAMALGVVAVRGRLVHGRASLSTVEDL